MLGGHAINATLEFYFLSVILSIFFFSELFFKAEDFIFILLFHFLVQQIFCWRKLDSDLKLLNF